MNQIRNEIETVDKVEAWRNGSLFAVISREEAELWINVAGWKRISNQVIRKTT